MSRSDLVAELTAENERLRQSIVDLALSLNSLADNQVSELEAENARLRKDHDYWKAEAEGQQEPVAWLTNLGRIDSPRYAVSFEGDKTGCENFPVYTRPSETSSTSGEQAVTEAMNLARAVLAQVMTTGFNTPGPTPEDVEKAFWALDDALKAAMEAGG